MFLRRGEEKGLIVKDPLQSGNLEILISILYINKHSESIAKAIQVGPTGPTIFLRGINPTKADQRGPSDTRTVLCRYKLIQTIQVIIL